MANADLLKGGVIVVVLLAVLAAFDSYDGNSFSRLTGAYYIYGLESEDAVTDCQFDLSSYPCMFGTSDGYFDGVIVVGDQASSEDTAGWVDIAKGLQNYLDAPKSTKLASQVVGSSQNVISVGAACANQMTSNLLGNPANCVAGLRDEMAVIKLVRQPNGKAAVIVMGYRSDDTKRASLVLANYKKWQDAGKLSGNEVVVTGTGLTDDTIAVFESEKSFNPNAGGGLYSGLAYTCYDGAGGGVSTSGNCVGYDEIRQSAEQGCLGHCATSDTQKCGVNNLKFTPCAATNQIATLPDLLILNYKVTPAEVFGNEQIKVSAEIWNAINRTYSGKPADIDVTFYVVLRLNGGVVGNASVPGLKFNSFYPYSFALGSVRSDLLKCGSNAFELSADDNNSVQEDREDNNKGVYYVTKKCPASSGPSSIVTLETGWNIIGYNTIYSRNSTTCKQDQFDETAHSWNPKISDFDKIKFDDLWSYGARFDVPISKITPDRLKAAWLYNKGDSCTFNSDLHLPPEFTPYLFVGWNMVGVQPGWEGKKLEEINSNCNTDYVWLYDPANAEYPWVFMTTETSKFASAADRKVFIDKDVGKGFWIYTEKECVLALN